MYKSLCSITVSFVNSFQMMIQMTFYWSHCIVIINISTPAWFVRYWLYQNRFSCLSSPFNLHVVYSIKTRLIMKYSFVETYISVIIHPFIPLIHIVGIMIVYGRIEQYGIVFYVTTFPCLLVFPLLCLKSCSEEKSYSIWILWDVDNHNLCSMCFLKMMLVNVIQ